MWQDWHLCCSQYGMITSTSTVYWKSTVWKVWHWKYIWLPTSATCYCYCCFRVFWQTTTRNYCHSDVELQDNRSLRVDTISTLTWWPTEALHRCVTFSIYWHITAQCSTLNAVTSVTANSTRCQSRVRYPDVRCWLHHGFHHTRLITASLTLSSDRLRNSEHKYDWQIIHLPSQHHHNGIVCLTNVRYCSY